MRSISPALDQAQRAASRDPVISAVVRNDWEAVRRLDFTLLNDTVNTNGSHDVAVDGQGNVHRVRMDSGTVKYQKLTPAQQETDANWDSWTDLVTGQGAKVAIAARGANVFVAYANAVGTQSRFRESTDYGATFAADAALQAHGTAIQDLAVAYKNDAGDMCAFALTAADAIHAKRRVAGVFDANVNSGVVADSLNGMAATFAFDYELLITGVETTTLRSTVWSCEFLDASATFDALRPQFQSEGALSGFAAPSLTFLDTWRAVFTELPSFSGGQTRTYRTYLHPLESWNRAAFIMRAPLPTDVNIADGLAVAHGGSPGYFFETSYERVRRAPTALVTLDVSNDVQALELVETTLDAHGWIDLVNPDDPTARRYALPHSSPLQIGNMVRIGVGYRTAAPTALQIASGTYTGDGTSSRAITGIGFQPHMLWIKCANRSGVGRAVFRTSNMPANESFPMSAGEALTDAILSLDADGFTIGNSAHVNSNSGAPTPTYHWLAIRDPNGLGANIDFGSYVGNGTTQQINTPSFSPAWLFVKGDDSIGTTVAVQKSAAMPSTTSLLMSGGTGVLTTAITSLDESGFTVGTSVRANQSGVTYYYVAFRQTPNIQTGTYTGDGTGPDVVNTPGLNPAFATIKGASGTGSALPQWRATGFAGTDSAGLGDADLDHTDSIRALGDENFTIGADDDTNESGVAQYWVAIASTATASGGGSAETEGLQDFWITAAEIHHDERRGRARLRLHLEGGLRRLRRLFAYASINHTTDDYRNIISGIMARAGLSLSVTNASTRSDTIVPTSFTIDPNTSAHAALRAALAFIADRCHVDQGSSVNLHELVSGAAAVYSLGNEHPDDPTEHPITRLRLRSAPPPAGEVHVEALTAALNFLWGGATDHEAADLALAPLARLRDFTSDAISEADETADTHIRQRRFDRDDGTLWCPPIIGLQLLDVLELTDPYAYSIPNYKKRVSEIRWRYRREALAAIFEQVIDLAPASDQDATIGGIE